jgi:Fe-S-cluster containining protein
MELNIKQLHNKFKFKCKRCGLCCDNTIIYLYPFDIKNICNKLNITTTEFNLKCSLFKLDRNNILRCILKNRPKCPFNDDSNCKIYELRPIRCRLFPLGRIFKDNKIFYALPTERCIGFNTGHKQTIQEWLDKEKVTEYNELTKDWNNFIIKLKSNNLIKQKPFQVIFKKIFYDFDDKLIKQYREKLGKEENLKDFMNNLYEIFNFILKNKIIS